MTDVVGDDQVISTVNVNAALHAIGHTVTAQRAIAHRRRKINACSGRMMDVVA